MRPMYSPISPSNTSWVPEKINRPAISQPQPASGPLPAHHIETTHARKTTPNAANPAPSADASRNGSTEKLIHALSHNRISRRSV